MEEYPVSRPRQYAIPKVTILVLFYCCTVFAIGAVGAEGPQQRGENEIGRRTPESHEYISGSSSVGIPIDIAEGHVVIPLKINGSRELKIAVDSGVPYKGIDLFHRALLDELGIKGHADTVSIQGINFFGQKIICLANEHMEQDPNDGLIGLTLFSSCVVEIDFDDNLLNLHDPSTFDPGSLGQPLEIVFKNCVPHIRGTLSEVEGVETDVLLAVDLGMSGGALLLYPDRDERIRIPEGAVEKVIGRSAAGEVSGMTSTVSCLKIGGFELEQVPGIYIRKNFFGRKGDGVAGTIGMEILRRFNLVFDYAGEKIYLAPNSQFGQPYRERNR